jgi:hypothetical protein
MRKRFSDIKNAQFYTADDMGISPIGRVTDLLIEDGSWNIRYVVVATDAPLSRQVLISPAAISGFDSESRSIAAFLTTDQVLNSPPLDNAKPISRQYEQALVDYYSWPIYWFGRTILKPQTLDSIASDAATESVDDCKDSNLRSANEICGYKIESQTGSAGVMKDLVIQMDSWRVDFATADSRSWLPQSSSMFSTTRISHVDWTTQAVQLDLSKSAIEPSDTRAEAPAITGEPLSAQPFRIA